MALKVMSTFVLQSETVKQTREKERIMLVCWCSGREVRFNKLGGMIGYFTKVHEYL